MSNSRPQFTPQQSAAILAKGVSVALSAGAGCGKTFVLTQRFLAGLEPANADAPSTDLHSLVAITFTERAAREMRDRIRAACHSRLHDCPPAEVDHWLGILRGLDSARISTIHSFCTGLLRSQAVDARLDPRFAVLEPALADTLLRNVVRDTFHELVEQEDADAVDMVVMFGLERAKETLRSLVTQRFQIDFDRFSSITAEDLANEWLSRWKRDFVPKLIGQFRESHLTTRVQQAIADSPSKNQTMRERIATLTEILSPHARWDDVSIALDQIRENARVQGGGGKKDWVSEERQEEIKLAFEELRDAAKDLATKLEYRPAEVIAAAELSRRTLRLTERIATAFDTAKKSQSVLDFDDLLVRARDLLRDHENVRQRIAAGIRLLMVDEFQDTDPVQAQIVRDLCGATMKNGKLFMVGDRKQSIYRFRRADPTVFTTMSAELPKSGQLPLTVNFRSQPAVLNFVNQLFAPAMDGYEALQPSSATQYSPEPAIEFLFATHDAEPPAATSQPPASSSLPSTSDEDERPNAAALRAREADWIARRIKAMLDDPTPRIRSEKKDDQGGPELRRVELGDIVILFRALSNVQEYEAALRRYGLDYYLVGGKAFFAQQEVFDLLNLCRYLDDCDDLIGLVGVLRSPFFNLSDDTIQALAFHDGQSSAAGTTATAALGPNAAQPESTIPLDILQASLQDADVASTAPRVRQNLHETLYLEPPAYLSEDQKHRVRFAAEVLTELRAIRDRIPLAEVLNRAIERTGYDAALLTEFLGARKLANLRKLIEMARKFDQGDYYTLKDFVTRLQTSVLEETDEEFATTQPESGEVLRLMSIHQSKGLEFPVVIVADIDRKGPPRASGAILHGELGPLVKFPEKFGKRTENLALRMHELAEREADAEETIRLFYVACTRAADYLILSAGVDPAKPPQSPWMDLIQTRFHPETGLLKFDPLLGTSSFSMGDRELIPTVFVHREPCKIKVSKTSKSKEIPAGEIPGRVIEAAAAPFPESAQIFPRDTYDQLIISVSRLETIDAELKGITHGKILSPPANPSDDVIDFDMATALGTLIHNVLERIDFRDTSNWREELRKTAEQDEETKKPEIMTQATTMLDRFFESPLSAELALSKSMHREIDFVLPWPSRSKQSANSTSNVLVAGIIDLLVQTESGWHILDYKTGEFPDHSADERYLAHYEIQLGIYARAVEQWFGQPPRELSLIVFRPEVRRITLPWTEKRGEAIRDRVNRVIDSLHQPS